LQLFFSMEWAQRAALADEGAIAARRVENEGWWRAAAWAVVGLTAVLLFARLGARQLWASEFRWAEIAREMMLTHDYFWPTLNGHVYYDKPLASYWLVVAATRLTGGMNEAAARLPSAVSGLLAVGLLIFLARRLYDLRIAVVAAFILATSYAFVFYSRTADADIMTIAGELAALLLFWRNRESEPGWWVVGLWSLMALTSLTKGLLGFVLPIMIIGVYSSITDRSGVDGLGAFVRDFVADVRHGRFAESVKVPTKRNRWFFNWYTPVAVGLAAAIYYWPFAISHMHRGSSQGLYMVYRENVERYFEPFDHVGPIYLYVYVIFILLAPWSVFLPAALAHAHAPRLAEDSRGEGGSGQYNALCGHRFVLTFFWATFIFFTLSGSRRSYYLLPILPAAAILLARVLVEPIARLNRLTRILLKSGFVILAASVAVSTLAFIPPRLFAPPPWSLLPPAPDRAMLAIYWIGSAIAIAYAIRRLDPQRIFLAGAATAWLFMLYLFVFALPAGDAWRGEKEFAHQVRAQIKGQERSLEFYNTGGPAFYLDQPYPVPYYNPRRDTVAGEGPPQWLVTRVRDVQSLGPAANVVAREAVYPWDSNEHALNAMVLVRMTRSPVK
jgi:4-amino-4-deoxy-L-arabinose transferase-like glycosyltransferase